ncbi:MAG: YceD family protein [Gemella sp.]|nr:YceD family protein [Gemella sp.]
MKWLRSTLFKNKDEFKFEKKVDIDIANFDASIEGVENVMVNGTLTRNGQDKILVDLNITGDYRVISSRSLNLVSVPFVIEETEDFIDKSNLYGEEDYDVLTMDAYIDISDLVKELILINAPLNYYSDEEEVANKEGKDWQLLTEQEVSTGERKDNPFSALGDMFKEK